MRDGDRRKRIELALSARKAFEEEVPTGEIIEAAFRVFDVKNEYPSFHKQMMTIRDILYDKGYDIPMQPRYEQVKIGDREWMRMLAASKERFRYSQG